MATVMAKPTTQLRSEKSSLMTPPAPPSPTVAEIAYELISGQYDRMIRQESGVLADQDPECLHQMRVGSRRLCTALQVFSQMVKLPKAIREKPVRALTKTLGRLRDLDVQIAAIREQYYPDLKRTEQKHLTKLLTALDRQRCQALAAVVAALTHPSHHQLKDTYKDWLHDPRYTAIADLPLTLLLPELLSPLLANLLLHPAWLIPIGDISQTSSPVLHDLRKTCKAVRYQAEFFTPFYGSAFQDWLKDLKQLQDDLGQVQDIWVLRQLLLDELGKATPLPELEKALQAKQLAALVNWETRRHLYLNLDFRCRLHQMILSPLHATAQKVI
jgi:CHAD domain-containing protein